MSGTPNYTGTPIPDGQEFALATAPFTIATVGATGSVNVAPSIFTSGIGQARFPHKWTQDGATTSSATNFAGGFQNLTAASPNTGAITVGQGVSLGTPHAEIAIEQPLGTGLFDGGSRSFGGVVVGANTSLTFTIKNIGIADLTGLDITVDGPDAALFTVTTGPTAPVIPGGSTPFTVRFAPTAGSKSAVLHIASNDEDENPFDILLTGVGVASGVVDFAYTPDVTGTSVHTTAVQPDGKTLLGGSFTAIAGQTRNNIARLDADGTLESTATFNPGTGASFEVTCLAVQPDGKIVLGGGFGSINGQPRNRIGRLNANGTVESTATFDPGTGVSDYVNDLVVLANGKILLGGEFTSVNGQPRAGIARLNANGSVESTATFKPGTGANSFVASVVLQADGKALLGGSFTSINGATRNRIARLNADGTVEDTATFNAGTGADGDIYCVALQSDGRILLGGDFTSVNGQTRTRIARLNADGSLESTATFNPGTGADFALYSIAVQADGKILLGGDFTSVDGQPRTGIARLNTDGSVESTATFNPGTGADGTVSSVALQADGRILLGGSFTSVDGQPHHLLARLFNDAATQTLTIPTNTRVVWLRGGSGPEVGEVTFELSTNGGANWNTLGTGARIAGGWEITGLSLSGFGQIRARGRTTGGYFNGSSGLVEQIAAFDFVTIMPALTAPATNAATTSPVSVSFSLPEVALPGSLMLTFHDGVTPRTLTLAASQETVGTHAFSFDIANPPASPQIASGPALPEGTYTVTLSYQDALGNPSASSAPATNVRIMTPLRLWKLINLGNADAPDLGDPDFDGLLTLAEYGLNLPPQTPNGAPFAATRFTYAEGERLRVFIQRDPAHNDVTVEVQASDSPAGTWDTVAASTLGSPFTGPGYVGGDSATPGIKTVEVRDTVNMNAATRRFVRVKVTH